jgi:uncharacterized membrane protein
MSFFYLFLLIIGLVVVVPVAIALFFVYLLTVGFGFLEFSFPLAVFMLFLMFVSSYINIPIGKKNLVEVVEPRFFGFFHRSTWRYQGVSINLGGAVIPIIIIGFFLPSIWQAELLPELGIITLIVALFSFIGSRFIEKRGVVISMILPVLFTALFTAILAPEEAAKVAFSSGVLGVLLGADIFHLPYALKKGKQVISIGGAGIFDGIFLVGIISAILVVISI